VSTQTHAGLPLSQDEARAAAQSILDFPGADAVEVMVSASNDALTRYANSEIIQNTVKKELRANVKVVVGDRSASSATNQLDPEHLKGAAARALEAATASVPEDDAVGLPSPDEVGRAEGIFRWDEATADASPDTRAKAVNEILKIAGDGNAAGIYQTGGHCYAVFNSNGIDCYDAYSRANTTCLIDVGDSTGWGEGSSHSASLLDVGAAAQRARDKADAGRGAGDAEPGTYEVILEASAAANLVDFLGYMGFGAKSMIEGESFFSSLKGQKVAADSVTVADDVFHPDSVGIGFDFEGVPKQRVAVIDKGTAVMPVTDRKTAKQLGTKSTGHNSGSPEFGPYGFNVVLEAGDKSLEELISEVKDGFLVTRFHYVNILDRPATDMTGMTRDGTFRIHNGELAGAVHNFRFAQSALGALKTVLGIGRDLEAIAPDYTSFGSTVAPALRVGEFHFASVTSH
jgi:predicted Zn-dependent protease